MTFQNTGTLLAFAGVSLTAWQLGGALGAGVLVGFLLGASLSGLGIAWQNRLMRTAQHLALKAFVVSFLGKLAVVTGGCLALRFVEPLAERFAWRGFLLAFVGAVMLIHTLRAIDGVFAERHRGATEQR